MSDHPFAEVVLRADEHIQKGRTVYQKWTCEKCGQRLGMEVPNVFYKTGYCEDCKFVTDLVAKGCNYMLEVSGDAVPEYLEELARKAGQS